MGAFIFLRFFCPAIVAPEVEGLVASPPPKEMRRGLLLIAKVIQNLANNVLFGAKEPYMYPLNDFLAGNIYKVTTFLREISVCIPRLDRTLAMVTNPSLHRSPQLRLKARLEASRLISGHVWHCTASSMITGTT